jgi:hypothetical protein
MPLAWPVLNQNQFAQSVVLGMITMDPQPDTIPCQFNPSSALAAGLLVAGAPVKLVNYAGAQIIVDGLTSASDGPIYGVVEYGKQKNVYVPGDQLNVAAKGNIVHLWSNAAIVRGTRVGPVVPANTLTPPSVQTDTTSGDYTIGVALGQVSAQNAFLRVQIDPGLNGGSVGVSP